MSLWDNLFRHGMSRATFPKGEGFGGPYNIFQMALTKIP
jgi:hypothetical protein